MWGLIRLWRFNDHWSGKYESDQIDQIDQKLFGYLFGLCRWREKHDKLRVIRQPAAPLVIGIIRRGHLEYRHGSPYQLGDLGVTGTQVLRPRRSGRNLRSRYRRRALPLAAYSLTTRYVMRLARALPLSLMAGTAANQIHTAPHLFRIRLSFCPTRPRKSPRQSSNGIK
ncbi:hypothetical protein BV392_20340 [Rhodovulum sulfidophilum]|nr:hypothetical protein BV392_20340 [Rhodovulum sulfidophilum]